ncbi:MAG: ABC transporter ATP-binding protein [Polyangiaceae bacterium]
MHELRRLLGFVRPYRRLSVLALVMLTTLVAFDLAIPRLVQRIVDEGIGKHDQRAVISTALVMLGISAISFFIAILNNSYSVRVGEGVARDLREALFTKIQTLSFADLDRLKTGELLVRLTSDVGAVKAFTQVSLRIGTRAPLMMAGSLVLMVTTSPRLALTLSPLLIVTAILLVVFVARLEPLYRNLQERLDRVNTVLGENVAGARLVKAFVRAAHERARFAAANDAMTERSIRVMRTTATMTPALTMCVNLGVVVVVAMGGRQSIEGELTLGQIVAFSNYLLTTMTPLIMMTMLTSTWAAGLASLRRIGKVLETEPAITDRANAITIPDGAKPSVRFEGVSFSYAEGAPAISDVSFETFGGKTIAILGATGAGKTTLVELIPRFYDATRGSVSVFDHDVRTVQQAALASRVGFVQQEAVLFSGTVRENIAYGRPSATDEEVERAARAAEAHAFIEELVGGYGARVEQRGRNFSGGQRQRLAIARALLVDPDVLVLDDSTSAVDVETEARIQAALRRGRPDRTTFIVAQRISTVLDADAILVLDKGRVVAFGTHDELLASSEVYREIYESQLGEGVAPRQEPA